MFEEYELIHCKTWGETQELDRQPEYTVEAEYGEKCLEGSKVTLAHHGERSDNPAPCNADIEKQPPGQIVISHIDLDTVGGIMAIMGVKPEDKKFWEAAEYIDVHGPHHRQELDPEPMQQLDAIVAWRANYYEEHSRDEDVNIAVKEWFNAVEKVVDRNHPEHDEFIRAGQQYMRDITKDYEERLTFENDYVRVFETKDMFCNSAYYSPTMEKDIPCCISLNTQYNTITVSFFDGGKNLGGEFSAREIVQSLWGPEAGGHDGIAGSPRGQVMDRNDLRECMDVVMDIMIARQHEIEEQDKALDKEVSINGR